MACDVSLFCGFLSTAHVLIPVMVVSLLPHVQNLLLRRIRCIASSSGVVVVPYFKKKLFNRSTQYILECSLLEFGDW